jgi:neutral trehalase
MGSKDCTLSLINIISLEGSSVPSQSKRQLQQHLQSSLVVHLPRERNLGRTKKLKQKENKNEVANETHTQIMKERDNNRIDQQEECAADKTMLQSTP